MVVSPLRTVSGSAPNIELIKPSLKTFTALQFLVVNVTLSQHPAILGMERSKVRNRIIVVLLLSV